MAFSQWRQWLRRFRDSIDDKPRRKTRRHSCLEVETLEDRVVPSWTQLTNVPSGNPSLGTMELLPNGTVMAAGSNFNISNTWYLLTPNSSGSYDNGTWSQLASSSGSRLYDGTVVLPNDKVLVYGGEYTDNSGNETEGNSGEVYNIATNSWTPMATIPASLDPAGTFGDGALQLLPSGNVLGQDQNSSGTFLYNTSTNSWSAGPTKIDPGVSGYPETSSEEAWVKLPGTGGNILDYELWASLDVSPGYGEYLNGASNTWTATGSVPVPLSEDNETELGPGLLLPNGDVFQIGANGSFGSVSDNTALYNPTTNTWTAGPVVPNTMTCDDASAAILPDGNVIFVADSSVPSDSSQQYSSPSGIFEYNYTTNSISALATPAALTTELESDAAYYTRMLALPNGQILFTDGTEEWTYSESGTVNASWAPTISNIASNGSAFTLAGTQLNGISEGAGYGDDAQAATNYPIVQLTNGAGQVSYAETSNWSLPGTVATASTAMSTTFAAPASAGPYLLSVSASGNSSSNVLFIDMGGNNYTLRLDPGNLGDVQVLQNGVTSVGDFPLASFTAIYACGNGNLTVDYSNGVIGMPVNYAGGAPASSAINVADSAAPTSVTFNATSADAGNFVVNGNAANEVLFTNVQSAFDTANPTTLTINPDPGNLISTTLTDTLTASGANSLATLSNNLPSLTFADPAGTLVVHGHSAANNIMFTAMGTGFNSALTVQGNAGTDTVALDAPLSLGSATATGDVSVTAATIDLGAAVNAGAGPTPGNIALTGNVVVTANSSLSFGGSNGLAITGGTVNLGANNLALNDFALADTANIGVLISGTGGSLTKAGPGTLTLSFANSYTGATTITGGTLADGVGNALPIGTNLGDSGTLNLAGFNQQVGAVTGSGSVTDSGAAAIFTVNDAGADSFSGTFGGGVALTKTGAGTLTLVGSSNNSGATSVSAGTLQVDGQLTSSVTVSSAATLDGTGHVGAVTVNSGGTVSPGDAAPGQLTINGNLTMTSGSSFADQIDGTTAGTGYGQLIVSGPVVGLNSAALLLSVNLGFSLPFNSAYELINNTGAEAIGSIFSGLPEGATVTASNGRQFTITYIGGTGNDVVVTEKPMTLVWDGDGADNNWTTGANWVGNAAPIIGDTLSFGASGALRTTSNDNNYTAGTSFNSIFFTSPGYILNGNALTLTNGISSQSAGTNTIDQPITLSGAQSFQTSGTTSTLDLNGAIHLAGNTLTTSGPGVIDADAAIDGTGSASAIACQGTGSLIIGNASVGTYAGTTTVSAGILEVDGSITSNVNISGGTLTGIGSTGAVNGNSGGTLYLGTSVSTLSSGPLNLQASSDFNVLLNADTNYSTITTGSVTLGSGSVLNLSATAGFVPASGDVFTIISNTGTSAVSGTFLAGTGMDAVSPNTPLPEGTIISNDFLNSGHTATITYEAGPNQRNVAIVVSSANPLGYIGGSSTNPNHFVIDQNINDPVPTLEIWDNGALVDTQATSLTSFLQVGVAAGLDATLTVDYTNAFTVPIFFDGGTGTTYAHTLTLENGSYTTATFNDSTASSGTITLDGEDITYSDLTAASPAIIDTTTQSNLVFDLPASAQGILEDDAGSLAGVSQINTTNGAFADVSFENPGVGLMVNGAGNGLIQLGAMDPAFSPATEAFTGQASDVFQVVSASAVPSATAVTLTIAELNLNGLNPTMEALNGNGLVTNSSTSAASILSVGANNGSGLFSGIIENGATQAVGLTKVGAGTETLSGISNTYSGPTTISAGVLQTGAVNALSSHSDVTDNATLDVKGFSQSIGALSGSGTVTSSATGTLTLTIGADNDGGTFSGVINNGSAASLAIAKSGTGTEILNSTTNIYTGGTSVTAGILQIGDGATFGSLGTAGVTIGVNGTLQFDSPANSSATAKMFANSISGAGSISVISANAAFGLGAVAVTGINTNFTGTLNIAGGSYQLGAANSLGAPSGINVSNGGQFYFGSATTLTVNAAIAISTTGYLDSGGTVGPLGAVRFSGPGDVLAGTLTVTGTALVSASSGGSGTIQGNISGAGTLDVGSGLSAETIVLTGSDGASTTINGLASLQVGNGGTTGALTGAAITDNGTLAFKRSDTVTVGVSISGTGSVSQAGNGTLILPNTNTYSYASATAVSSGSLQVDGSIASNVTVAGTGHLTGTGTTGNVTTTTIGSTVAPGDPPSTGTLSTGALTLSAGAVFNVGISGVNTASQVIASGAISLNGAVLNLAMVGGYIPSGGDVYTIIVNNAGSTVSGEFVAGAGIDNFAPGTLLAQGADLSDNFMGTGRTAILVYNYGPDGNSVAVEVSAGGQFRYNNPGPGTHNFLLKENAATGNFELYDTTVSTTVPVATQTIALTTVIDVNLSPAQPDDAALTIDYGGGLFTNKVIFDGGTGSGTLAKTLTFENSSATTAFTSETFTCTGPQSGNILLDVQPVDYYDLASIADAASITAANVAFTLPAATQATFGDDNGVGNGLSKLTAQNGSFAATTFADPATALSVQTAGSSLVQLGVMDSGFSPTSEIFTGQSNDQYRLTNASALHSATSVFLNAAILDLRGLSPTINGLNGSGTITNGVATGATLTIGGAAGGNFSGVIQNGVGAVSLTKSGAGAQELAGACTYTGATTINGGNLVLGTANALPIGTNLTINSAGFLDVSGNNQQVASLTGAGEVLDGGGAATFTINNSAADTFAGPITGSVALVKQGVGTLTLTHANTYGGSTTVSAGTLKQGAAGAVPGNGLTVNGTLDLGGFGLQIPSIAGSGTVTNSSSTAATFTVNNAGADPFSGAITGNTALTESGGGTLTLSKPSTYIGATTISAGTIADTIANALPIATALCVTGTFDLAGFAQQLSRVTGAGAVTDSGGAAVFTVNNAATDSFAGTLSGSLALTKIGAGILILNGIDTYTGQTTISAGTVQLANANAIPAASNVTDNATLDVHGNTIFIGALTGSSASIVTDTVATPATLDIGFTNSNGTFSGVIKNGTGNIALIKTGSGVETLGGVNSYTGATEIDAGTLTVNGTLYAGSTVGEVDLVNAGVILNGAGTVRGHVAIEASNAGQNIHIDGVTITVPAAGQTGITVNAAATFAQIGVTKGVIVNGGNTTSTGVLVNGSAMIFNSNISGHLVDVDVNGGSAVLQKDTLNAGATAGIGWTGLRVENSAIVDAGQSAANATPLPAPYAQGNVGLYGDITGLFSGTPLGSTAHSTGGNTFNGYTASAATTNPTTVAQAIRDLNTGAASFGALNNGVENSFTYGGGFHLGRMDLTAQGNTFNGVARPTNAAIKSVVFDGARNSAFGFVVYGVPTMTVTQSGVPSYVAPSNSYTITINYANAAALPTFGIISEYVPSNETANLALDPGWVSMGSGLYTYNLGLLGVGASGGVQFSVTVNAKPTLVTLTNEATIETDLFSGIVVAVNYISTTTTVSPNNVRWPF